MSNNLFNGPQPQDGNGASPLASPRGPSDAQMEQIRDLLFGNIREEILSRLSALERRLDTLEHAMKVSSKDDDDKRRAAFDSLATAVGDLGARIQQLARS